MDAENTHKVFENLWTSGQLSAADIARLPELGVELVINLALPSSSNALPGEAELITGHGITYVQIPVLWEDPKPVQFRQFVDVMNAHRDRTVWVHCAKNMRVSAFMYLYRKLVLGESEEDASYPMRAVWQPNATWQAFIERVTNEYKPSPAALSRTSPLRER